MIDMDAIFKEVDSVVSDIASEVLICVPTRKKSIINCKDAKFTSKFKPTRILVGGVRIDCDNKTVASILLDDILPIFMDKRNLTGEELQETLSGLGVQARNIYFDSNDDTFKFNLSSKFKGFNYNGMNAVIKSLSKIYGISVNYECYE